MSFFVDLRVLGGEKFTIRNKKVTHRRRQAMFAFRRFDPKAYLFRIRNNATLALGFVEGFGRLKGGLPGSALRR